jgi:hypothetical protein
MVTSVKDNQSTKRNQLSTATRLAALALLAGAPMAMGQNVLLLVADSASASDPVRNSILATGLLTSVDIYPFGANLPTPTLAELLQYHAVVTWTNLSYADGAAMGSVLADYVDAGGGVVCAVYTVSTTTVNRSLTGRWETGGYDIIPQRSSNLTSITSLGAVHQPSHPLWSGMTGFSGATNYARATTTAVTAHGLRVADWASGQVLAATSTMYPNRVDLGFYPPAWHSTTDGARLLANALVVASTGGTTDPGGCCFNDGMCQVLAGIDCISQGGAFRGPNTDCLTPCPQPGRCCFPNGSCEVILETACNFGGGTWAGAGTDCTPNPCPQPPTGACCLDGGSCTVVWEPGCLDQGGVYQGDGTDCTTPCPYMLTTAYDGASTASVAGAGAFFNVTAVDSQGLVVEGFQMNTNSAAGTAMTVHVYVRPGTHVGFESDISAWIHLGDAQVISAGQGNRTYVPIGGLQIGANETWGIRVGAQNGGIRYNSAATTVPVHNDGRAQIDLGRVQNNFFGTLLTTNPAGWNGTLVYTLGATVTTGSCCFPDGSCTEVREVVCAGTGGIYHGDNTTCATTPVGGCPQPPTGACCLADSSCITEWSGGCAAAGGTYMGDGTQCTNITCPFVLATAAPNNGVSGAGSGIMLDLTPNDDINVLRMDTVSFSAAGTPIIVEIWTVPGSYVPHRLDPTPWTLHDTVSTVSAGNLDPAVIQLNTPLELSASTTTGIFISMVNGGIRYTGATNAQPIWSDAILTLYSEHSLNGPWAAGNSPRVFSGAIYYTLGSPACYANCDNSTTPPVLNVEDFVCFINEFAQGQLLPTSQQITHYANCDGSTTEPVLNVEDFICFINEFSQGCP